jgi:threonine dehydratase
MAMLPTFSDVQAAAVRIAPHAVRTPLVESAVLNALTGGRIFLKLETMQRTGSFKFRGACNRLAMIPEADRARGVVAFSSGNHAQGVAAAASLFGMPAVIVMPKDAPRPKIEGTRAYGATIVEYDRVHDDREAIAAAICAERGAVLVKPFDDEGIIAGQGTVGLEIAAAMRHLRITLDDVLVPCSGGGLVSGIALALSGSDVGIHSVEPENFDGMRRSLEAGKRTQAPGGKLSIADALMAPIPGNIVFEVAKHLLAPGFAVSDAELKRAVIFAAEKLKLLVEPGGAAALAALLAGKLDAKGKTVALVLSGANADFAAIAEIVARLGASADAS